MYANSFTFLFAGYTPLQVAFELYREDWAKLLIEAGADQTCRDKSGRNILHSLLQRHIEKDEEVHELKRMLEIIDKRVLQTLFVERSTGSVTPLQYWLSLSGAHRTHEQVLKLIFEYGGGQELNFISGEGDTPLHYTVKNGNSELTRIILEHDATLLNRENATGRTPYEMAEDRAIANVCNSPPPMPSDSFRFNQRHARRLGLKFDWSTDLINQSRKSFVEKPNDALPSQGSGLWSLLQETKARLDAEGRSVRRLVTLNEANEVAKRLAAMKAGHTVHREETYDEPEDSDEDDVAQSADEVETFMGRAKQSL